LSDTAVGEPFTAVDLTAVVGDEEHRDFSHFVLHAVAAERCFVFLF
jgi:hypothetical protein